MLYLCSEKYEQQEEKDMENNSKGSKAAGFLQKMYNFRVKVDRKGKPIINVSSIFGAACLIFAPHMPIVGVVAALILGYQIHFESENDDGQIEERLRNKGYLWSEEGYLYRRVSALEFRGSEKFLTANPVTPIKRKSTQGNLNGHSFIVQVNIIPSYRHCC